jgi:hypothetical protein
MSHEILAMPKLPTPDELKATGDPNAAFDAWESETKAVEAANDDVFAADLKVMKRCALLNGVLGRSTSRHFGWCPQPKWEAYWETQGWPKLPTLE